MLWLINIIPLTLMILTMGGPGDLWFPPYWILHIWRIPYGGSYMEDPIYRILYGSLYYCFVGDTFSQISWSCSRLLLCCVLRVICIIITIIIIIIIIIINIIIINIIIMCIIVIIIISVICSSFRPSRPLLIASIAIAAINSYSSY